MFDVRGLFAAAACSVTVGVSSTLAGLAEYQAAVNSETSLISYYTFDADTGTSVLDTKPAGHNGTIMGTGTTFAAGASAFGGQGQALSLNGSGWVNFGAVAAFAFGGQTAETATPGTVEMWIRPGAAPNALGYAPTLASVREVAPGGDPNPYSRWSMHLETSRLAWGVYGGIMGYHPAPWDFTADQWYHVAFVFTPSYNGTGYPTTRAFVNGIVLNDFWGFLGAKTDAPFQIGAATPAGLYPFVGLIDEVAVYSDRVSDSAIAQHYLAGVLGPPAASTPSRTAYAAAVMTDAPLGYYSFEGDTTSVADNSGHGHNGTLVAPTSWTSGFAGGQALVLDSSGKSGGRVSMGGVEAFKLADGSGTLEAWIAPAEGLRYLSPNYSDAWPFTLDWAFSKWRPTIFSCADDFSALFHYGLELRISDQSLGLETYNTGYPAAGAATPFPGGWVSATEKWHHLAAVFSGGNVSYYVNGQQAGVQMPLDPTPPPGVFQGLFQIGAGSPTGDWGFPGKIDEVAIYDAALTPAQVAAHYAAAAMSFDIHSHAFVDPNNFTPLNLTLSAPTGQSSPAGLQITFTYKTSVITVKSALPPPNDVVIPSGTPFTVPVSGLTSFPLQVIPVAGVDGGYGTTTLTVTPDPSSGWLYGDRVQITSRPVIVDGMYVSDHFDDGVIGTNAGGAGGGWLVPYSAKGQPAEEASSAKILATPGWYAWTGMASKGAGEFPFMTPDGIRIEWVINYVQLTAAGGASGAPNSEGAECYHELGVISADAPHNGWNELYRNTAGGLYVNLYYSGYSGSPTETITVKGSVRVVNSHHLEATSSESVDGLETPVVFELTGVHSITPDKPLIVTLELDANGWELGFSPSAGAVYSVWPIGATRPGLTINTLTQKVHGGWDTDTLGSGSAGAAITTEFNNWAFLFAAFHNIVDGNGQGWIDSAKACTGCALLTDCPDPFADADKDNDVDMDDFGGFQRCLSGFGGGIPFGCGCFDHDHNISIDANDFTAFNGCAALSGPSIPVPKTCDD